MISCNVCLDLIPLVRDGVASEDSKNLVNEHIENCENCKFEFDNSYSIKDEYINDKKVINKLKRSILFICFGFILIGAFLGITFSYSSYVFYNFILMPMTGILSYFILKRKWYYTTIIIFITTFIWMIIKNISEGILIEYLYNILALSIYLSTIYTLLSLAGTIIAALLKFAFGTED